MFYYVMCTEKNGQLRKANRIHAKSITIAKRIASILNPFVNGCIKIGVEVDNNGFVRNPLYVKENGKWYSAD